jgi:hypothetical protein
LTHRGSRAAMGQMAESAMNPRYQPLAGRRILPLVKQSRDWASASREHVPVVVRDDPSAVRGPAGLRAAADGYRARGVKPFVVDVAIGRWISVQAR